MAENSNSGWGTGTPDSGTGAGTSTGTGSTGSTGTTGTGGSLGSTGSSFGTSSGGGSGSGATGSGSSSMGGGTGSSGGTSFGVTSATDRGTVGDTGLCPHCGQSIKGGGGLEQFLGRLGITEEMIGNLKTQFQNVEIDEYLNTARDYLKDGSGKATTYAKENPGKVAAGVAALALGAGLLYAATNRDKT
jgi:hypothetical protein